MAPSLNFRILQQCRDELRLHIEEALAIQSHNLIVVTKTWVQVFWFEVLCAVSRDHDRALVIFVLTMSQFIFIFFLFNWLVIISLSHELFFPFFLFSFLPSILSLPRAASTWTWQRLSSLVCTFVPRSFSRHTWFLNPDFSSVFSQTDDGVDAETFLPDFLNKLNFTFASFGKISHQNTHSRLWKLAKLGV